MKPQRLFADLISRVRQSIQTHGYCIFGPEEMERLFSQVRANHSAKIKVLCDFADACGVELETTAHLTSARFLIKK